MQSYEGKQTNMRQIFMESVLGFQGLSQTNRSKFWFESHTINSYIFMYVFIFPCHLNCKRTKCVCVLWGLSMGTFDCLYMVPVGSVCVCVYVCVRTLAQRVHMRACVHVINVINDLSAPTQHASKQSNLNPSLLHTRQTIRVSSY